jgi:hypothetical protein
MACILEDREKVIPQTPVEQPVNRAVPEGQKAVVAGRIAFAWQGWCASMPILVEDLGQLGRPVSTEPFDESSTVGEVIRQQDLTDSCRVMTIAAVN